MNTKLIQITLAVLMAVLFLPVFTNAQTQGNVQLSADKNNANPGEQITVTVTPSGFDSFYAVQLDTGKLEFTGDHTADNNPEGLTFVMLSARPFTIKANVPQNANPKDELIITGLFWNDPNDKINTEPLKVTVKQTATISLITVPTSLSVPEAGQAQFGIKLSAQPASTITVSVIRTGGDTDISVQSGSTLTFTPSDWDTYQTVIVAAAEDPDSENGTAVITVSSAGLNPEDVTITEADNDNDIPDLSVTPGFREVPATSGSASFTISAEKETIWKVLYPPDTWFSAEPAQGVGNGTVTVNYNANTGSARTGIVTIMRTQDIPGNYYINFQDPEGEPSADPLIADGKEYMKIGWNEYNEELGYGWYGDMANVMYQYLSDGPDELQKSIIFDNWGRQKTFEFDLPNGTYNVTVSVGWQGKTYSHNKIDIEGVSFVSDETTNPYIVRTKEVTISDSRLTMEMGISDEYTMLNYLDIEPVTAQTVEIRQAPGYEGNYQAAILKPGSTSLTSGESLDVTLVYDCSDNTVASFAAAVYYDSAIFAYESSTVLYETGMFGEIQESTDTENKDGDETTDRFLATAYLDIMGAWPGTELPLDLVTFHFTIQNSGSTTSVNVRSLGTPGGFEFQGIGVDFTVCCDISLPTVKTAEVNSVTPTTALISGNVISEGGTPVTARGICWSTSPVSEKGPLPGTHTVNSSGTGSFTSSVTGLIPDTTYYIRAYATNARGTSFGQGLSFKTLLRPGDVNGNKIIGLDDAILVLNIISGTDTGDIVIRSDADVNQDGKIGLQESVYVLQIVADLL